MSISRALLIVGTVVLFGVANIGLFNTWVVRFHKPAHPPERRPD